MDAVKAYGHLDTMQKVCMDDACMITLEEWLAENEEKQHRYYDWMRNQYIDFVGYWTAAPRWE